MGVIGGQAIIAFESFTDRDDHKAMPWNRMRPR